MILKNKRTLEELEISYFDFRKKFAKEIQISFDSYRKTQLNKYSYKIIDADSIKQDFYLIFNGISIISEIQIGT